MLVAATIAAAVWLIVSGTTLETQAAVWLAYWVALVTVARRKPRERRLAVLWACAVVLGALNILRTFAQEHRWHAGDVRLIGHVSWLLAGFTVACLLASLLLDLRARQVGRPRT
jgi:hypothetical protein